MFCCASSGGSRREPQEISADFMRRVAEGGSQPVIRPDHQRGSKSPRDRNRAMSPRSRSSKKRSEDDLMKTGSSRGGNEPITAGSYDTGPPTRSSMRSAHTNDNEKRLVKRESSRRGGPGGGRSVRYAGAGASRRGAGVGVASRRDGASKQQPASFNNATFPESQSSTYDVVPAEGQPYWAPSMPTTAEVASGEDDRPSPAAAAALAKLSSNGSSGEGEYEQVPLELVRQALGTEDGAANGKINKTAQYDDLPKEMRSKISSYQYNELPQELRDAVRSGQYDALPPEMRGLATQLSTSFLLASSAGSQPPAPPQHLQYAEVPLSALGQQMVAAGQRPIVSASSYQQAPVPYQAAAEAPASGSTGQYGRVSLPKHDRVYGEGPPSRRTHRSGNTTPRSSSSSPQYAEKAVRRKSSRRRGGATEPADAASDQQCQFVHNGVAYLCTVKELRLLTRQQKLLPDDQLMELIRDLELSTIPATGGGRGLERSATLYRLDKDSMFARHWHPQWGRSEAQTFLYGQPVGSFVLRPSKLGSDHVAVTYVAPGNQGITHCAIRLTDSNMYKFVGGPPGAAEEWPTLQQCMRMHQLIQ